MSYNYPLLGAFLTMMWFFLWMLWIILIIMVVIDLFRNDELSGWGKAGWLVLVIVLPFIGVLAYLIVHGTRMGMRHTIGGSGGSGGRKGSGLGKSHVDQLAQLADMKADGTLDNDEYIKAKGRILH